MKISYAILTHNEGRYIQKLLNFLVNNKRSEDEIVIVDDFSSEELTLDTLERYKDNVQIYYREFDGDHTQKNFLNNKCTGDYIFQLDADEIVTLEFLHLLPQLLEANKETDLFLVPRINTVEGLTQEHIDKWRWNVNDKGWVNYPDYQMRLYRNNADIKWTGLLHSIITGHKSYIALPQVELYSMLHPKEIQRQEEQNNLYDKIEANGRTKYKV